METVSNQSVFDLVFVAALCFACFAGMRHGAAR